MDNMLKTDEVAHLLRTSPETLRYWRYVGTGPPSARVGRRVLYREADVTAWLDKQFGEAGPATGPAVAPTTDEVARGPRHDKNPTAATGGHRV